MHAALVAAAGEFATLANTDLAALLRAELHVTIECHEALKQAAGSKRSNGQTAPPRRYDSPSP